MKKKILKIIIIVIGIMSIINLLALNRNNKLIKNQKEIENLDLAFYNGSEKLENMPEKNNSNNLVFDHGECDNGASVLWNKEEWAPLIKNLSKCKTKCSLYFKKMFDDKYIYDLSNNNYNGTLVNGAVIKEDDGQRGIFFDGTDDFVDIVDFPDTIDWNSGFTIEFKAKWLKLNAWSRILDFGNGAEKDNIVIANNGIANNIVLDTKYNNETRRVLIDKAINLDEIQHIKIEVVKNDNGYTYNAYKNNELIKTQLTEVEDLLYNIPRTNNYLGKSNWLADDYFNGYIYYLKINDKYNNPILIYDFNF